ncbi:MAG TPA: amino acid ABC transporter permease [Actinomycetes bacterium]|nr:amino acid ABC transporter permease [Actinomycetes bacterium]
MERDEARQGVGLVPPSGRTPPERIRAVPVRHWGRWLFAVVVALLVAWIATAVVSSHFAKWDQVRHFLANQAILHGLVNTVVLSVLAQLVGIALGLVLAVMRLSRNAVLTTVSSLYIWFFRGTPVLVQLIFWYNIAIVFKTFTIAVPFTDVTLISRPMNDVMTPFVAALLGLGLNEGAYMAEICRAGIISVAEGQTEAAYALGMSSSLTMRRVVLPQAVRVIIPPTGNEFISMLKTSSLVYVTTFGELMRRASDIYSTNFLVIELLIVVSIYYLALTSVASVGQYYLERYFARGAARTLPETPLQRARRNLLTVRRRREWE